MKSMKEYIPYSQAVWEDIQKDVADGHLTVIDTQLSGACNAHCVYCDTPTGGGVHLPVWMFPRLKN